MPAKMFDDSKFKDGHAFDGSSIAGWKGIEASDMLLMPDADSARMDLGREAVRDGVADDDVAVHGKQNGGSLGGRRHDSRRARGLPDRVVGNLIVWALPGPGARVMLCLGASRFSPHHCSAEAGSF